MSRSWMWASCVELAMRGMSAWTLYRAFVAKDGDAGPRDLLERPGWLGSWGS